MQDWSRFRILQVKSLRMSLALERVKGREKKVSDAWLVNLVNARLG